MRELGVPDPAVMDMPGIGVFIVSLAVVVLIGWATERNKNRGGE